VAVANLSVVPEPTTHREVGHLVDAIAPILNGYWAYEGMYEIIADSSGMWQCFASVGSQGLDICSGWSRRLDRRMAPLRVRPPWRCSVGSGFRRHSV
jgi:hypothetical protein